MIVPVFALVLGLHGKVILPPWPATWLMNASTIIQPCNMSGPFDPEFGSKFGEVEPKVQNDGVQEPRKSPK
eukprot:gene27387-23862_t